MRKIWCLLIIFLFVGCSGIKPVPHTGLAPAPKFRMHDKSVKSALADNDAFLVEDSEDSNATKYTTTAYIKTYMDIYYQPLDANLTDLADGNITGNFENTAYPWADNEVTDGLTINAQAGSTWDIADSINASSVFSGSTSLEETTSANDSGAYIIGVYDEFSNSNATNVQDVLDDLDAAIGSGSGAPADATYIVQTADGNLTNAQDLASLATGILKSTNGTGIVSIAVDGTDYLAPSRIDDTKGNGDTDYVWSADKVHDQLALKEDLLVNEAGLYSALSDVSQFYEPGDAAELATVDTGHGANELYKMDQNVTTTSDVTFGKVTATNGISAGATSNPRARFLDSDCPGSDKFVGSVEISYVDGADGSENADIFLRSQEGGANTTQMQYDGSENAWKIPAEKNLVLESGYVVGKAKRGSLISANTTLATTDLHGTVYTVNATCTVTLDAASDVGYDWVCGFKTRGAVTLTLEIDDADKFDLHGTVLDAGDTIDSPGNAGDFIFLMSSTDVDGSGTDGYETWGYGKASWTDGGPD